MKTEKKTKLRMNKENDRQIVRKIGRQLHRDRRDRQIDGQMDILICRQTDRCMDEYKLKEQKVSVDNTDQGRKSKENSRQMAMILIRLLYK